MLFDVNFVILYKVYKYNEKHLKYILTKFVSTLLYKLENTVCLYLRQRFVLIQCRVEIAHVICETKLEANEIIRVNVKEKSHEILM